MAKKLLCVDKMEYQKKSWNANVNLFNQLETAETIDLKECSMRNG